MRAQFFEAGIDPNAVGRMSLYEILTMQIGRQRLRKGMVQISDEEWDEGQSMLAELAARDPTVRI